MTNENLEFEYETNEVIPYLLNSDSEVLEIAYRHIEYLAEFFSAEELADELAQSLEHFLLEKILNCANMAGRVEIDRDTLDYLPIAGELLAMYETQFVR